MPFNDQESSREDGSPIDIYTVVYGRDSGAVYRFTDSPVDLTVDGEVYEAIPVTRTEAQIDGVAGKSDITVTIPISHELSSVVADLPQSIILGMVIRQGHMPDDPSADQDIDDWPPVWGGFVSESRREDSTSELTCKTPLSDLETPGLRRFYQWQCPHILYGNRCQANEAAATTTATVATVNNSNTITFEEGGGWMVADMLTTDYIGGVVSWESSVGTVYAAISSVAGGGASIRLQGRLTDLEAGVEVSIRLGCARNLDACGRVHDNIINYGGQPWIPTENPLSTANVG